MGAVKILITGSNGLLGQKLVNYCIAQQLDFLATANSDNKNSKCPTESFVPMDITHREDVHRIVHDFKPTHIINAAAMTNVDACEIETQQCYAVNRDGAIQLFMAAKELNAHFIQISTDFIFDGQQNIYTEEDTPNPLGVYGKSKWEAERELLASAYDKVTILRTSLLYGVGENLNKGNIFSWAIDALRAGKKINIVDDQYRTPTFADDLANACFKVIELTAYGVFNIAGDELASMYQWIVQVAAYLQVDAEAIKPITTHELKQKAPRPQSSGLNILKAKEKLAYLPTPFIKTLSKIDGQV